jgi:16S rRNA G1207 methylase RsmC
VTVGHAALKRGGRLLVVTRQPNDLEPLLGDYFGDAARWERRGYTIFEVERDGRLRAGPRRER